MANTSDPYYKGLVGFLLFWFSYDYIENNDRKHFFFKNCSKVDLFLYWNILCQCRWYLHPVKIKSDLLIEWGLMRGVIYERVGTKGYHFGDI